MTEGSHSVCLREFAGAVQWAEEGRVAELPERTQVGLHGAQPLPHAQTASQSQHPTRIKHTKHKLPALAPGSDHKRWGVTKKKRSVFFVAM